MRRLQVSWLLVVLLVCFSYASIGQARQKPKSAAPAKAAQPAPQGPAPTITVAVDASEAPRRIFHARMTIPASGNELTVYYPKWIPGEHGPTGPIVDTAGVTFSAGGRPLLWRRDPLDMYTYHVELPPGTTQVEATMDYLAPVETPGGFTAGSSTTARMAVMSWNWLLLYPKGWTSDQIQVRSSLRLPQGWKFGTALPVATQAAGTIEFAPASLTTMVDSPVIMGAHMKTVPLQEGKKPPHQMDIAADSEAALQMSDEQRQLFDNLVVEAGAMFGARHYRDYHFLVSLSDHVAHFGLEHHESNDSRFPENYLTDANAFTSGNSLLPHEFVHSWNGKYRRPADLATPEYTTPMQSELLWVYEGLTNYLGIVLTARSSLWTAENWRDTIARDAMRYTYRSGRRWRPVSDTATAAQLLFGASNAWANWRRGVDFYEEGALMWLEADVLIRQQTGGKKSLDDFTQLFHGAPDSGPMVRTYTFDEVVNTLNQVAPYDWRKFLTDRIRRVAPQPPLGGTEQGGWRIVYRDTPNAFDKIRSAETKGMDCTASLGMTLKQDGTIEDVVNDGLASKAGLGPGMKVIAVNGRRYTNNLLTIAMMEARDSKDPIQFIVENAEFYRTVAIDYHDGPRYPHLVRDPSKPDILGDIIRPKATKPPAPAAVVQ